MQELSTINFHGDEIQAVQKDGQLFIAMKELCESIGVNWKGQLKRIKRDEVLNSVGAIMTATGSDGKNYEMMFLPHDMISGWLFGLSLNSYTGEKRDKIKKYKLECYQVLNDYFNKGGAINPNANDEQLAELKGMVNNLETACIQRDGVIAFMSNTMAPVAPKGTVSEVNGKEREYLVHSYFRSDKGHLVDDRQIDMFSKTGAPE